MTEAEWFAATDPDPLLEFLKGRASDRKLRLFACACCRRVGHLPWDVASRTAVETAEQFADGLVSKGRLSAARGAVRNTVLDHTHSSSGGVARIAAGPDAWGAAKNTARNAAWAVAKAGIGSEAWNAERRAQAALAREIVGDPFRAVAVSTAWPAKVTLLARSMYNGEDHVAGLREALAGAPELADHFLLPVHPKGCWAVDLILGKS